MLAEFEAEKEQAKVQLEIERQVYLEKIQALEQGEGRTEKVAQGIVQAHKEGQEEKQEEEGEERQGHKPTSHVQKQLALKKFAAAMSRNVHRMRSVDLFRGLDLDRSGKVSRKELQAGLKRIGMGEWAAEEVEELLGVFDTDGDGEISMRELKEGLEKLEVELREGKYEDEQQEADQGKEQREEHENGDEGDDASELIELQPNSFHRSATGPLSPARSTAPTRAPTLPSPAAAKKAAAHAAAARAAVDSMDSAGATDADSVLRAELLREYDEQLRADAAYREFEERHRARQYQRCARGAFDSWRQFQVSPR
jgi:Ca2+-binding EF-hand superfamily protein